MAMALALAKAMPFVEEAERAVGSQRLGDLFDCVGAVDETVGGGGEMTRIMPPNDRDASVTNDTDANDN